MTVILQDGKLLKELHFRLSCRVPGLNEQGAFVLYGQGYPHDSK
jgi:hypothetical protein